MVPEQPPPVPRLHPFTLGDWLVDPRACHISRGDTVLKLRAQLIDLLVCLARREGEIALKDEILAEVWPGQYIAESGVSRCIAELRQVLQDDAQHPRYIETITKRGYRIVAPVVWLPVQDEAAVQERAEPAPDVRAQEGAMPVAKAAEAAHTARKGRRLYGRRGAWAALALMLVIAGMIAIRMFVRTPTKILTERDPVLLAFENQTGDAVFDETIPLAVSIQLEQSPYLALLSPARVQEVLRMMKRPPDTPVTRAVGLEVCERIGGAALIVTSIARLGQQYVIGLEAVACGTASVLARQQATAERKEAVLEALQRAAAAIRLAVGESAASLERYRVPAFEATTTSLEALRAVRRGDLAYERGESDLALGLYRDAVALDADFALAHSRLGRLAVGGERLAALQKAYDLRPQVTLPERLEIEASYHRYVTGDGSRVVEALELLSRSYPQRARYRHDLASEYMNAGRYEAALVEAREAVRLEPNSAVNTAGIARAHLFLNQVAEARQEAERALALGSIGGYSHVLLFWCAVAANDEALRAREHAWMAGPPPDWPPYWLEDQAEESMGRGRLAEAVAFMKKMEAWADERGAKTVRGPGQATAGQLPNSALDMAARARLRMARYEALCGFGAQAMRRVEAELDRHPGVLTKMDAVRATVSAGRFDVAERLLNEIDRQGQPGDWGATLARTYRAAIAASRGQTAQALDLLIPLEPFELGFVYSLEPAFERARAHYLAGDWVKARAAFEKILAHPMIDSGRKLLPHAELGLARTLARAGDIAGSRRTYELFFDRWRQADPDLPVLLQARREYAALQKK
jgi:DNA-binding winged helix-turn-helix (wHTH) protein/tetratricopeptide (TPR) repeat protein